MGTFSSKGSHSVPYLEEFDASERVNTKGEKLLQSLPMINWIMDKSLVAKQCLLMMEILASEFQRCLGPKLLKMVLKKKNLIFSSSMLTEILFISLPPSYDLNLTPTSVVTS